MKTIVKMTWPTGNSAGQEDSTDVGKEIKDYLSKPEDWDDDTYFGYTEGNVYGICYIDDLIGEKIKVGNEIIEVNE
jgi:hypothetical protein